MTDNVNHPAHYNVDGLEVIDIIEAFTKDLNSMDAYETGNIIKYILRWPHKNGLEDLKKARWYLNHMIARLEAVDAWYGAVTSTAEEDKELKTQSMREIIERKKEEMYGKKD